MDAELPFVPEQDAPGVSAYRTEIADLLRTYPIESLPHDQIIATIEDASRHFNVLVLKTNMAIPYTSVFIRLDCKYWSADAEKRLRARMAAAAPAHSGGSPGPPAARPRRRHDAQHAPSAHAANQSSLTRPPAHAPRLNSRLWYTYRVHLVRRWRNWQTHQLEVLAPARHRGSSPLLRTKDSSVRR